VFSFNVITNVFHLRNINITITKDSI